MLVVERGINVSSGIVTFLSRKEFTFTALYFDLFRYVQFVVKQGESSLPSSSGAPNENIVQNHLNTALLNVF